MRTAPPSRGRCRDGSPRVASWPASLAKLTAISLLFLAVTASTASAGIANAGVPGASSSNPLAGLPWGHYSGPLDEVFPAYNLATGRTRRLLGLIALRPRARWFGAWYPNAQVEQVISQYIANVTGGDPNVLSQVAVFRLMPWEQAACQRVASPAEQASYKRWIDAFAQGIGAARVALILQPDLPFAMCAPHHARVPLGLVAYSARVFAALPHTTVYIDVGAADWPTVGHAVGMLRSAGIRYARGFALNATHYDSTQRQIMFGQRVVDALGSAHILHRHFVINTAENGRPFTFQQYHGPHYDNAGVCQRRSSTRCVTLGIPPGTAVDDRRWGLSLRARRIARRAVDAYLWFGRPWLDYQSDPFDLPRAIALAATTPF